MESYASRRSHSPNDRGGVKIEAKQARLYCRCMGSASVHQKEASDQVQKAGFLEA